MNKDIALEINSHTKQAHNFLRLANDNFAVAWSEEVNLNRKHEYLGYAEDYSRLASKELTKAHRLLSNELHKASLPVNK